MAWDCPEEMPKKAPGVNFISPEVAALTRAQISQNTPIVAPNHKPERHWQKLKEESVHITKELQKIKPLHKDPLTTQNQCTGHTKTKI